MFACILCACSGLGEARHTVATADSLRVNHGVAYANGVPANNVQRGVGDSLALAEAYVTTGKWRYIYPNDYARACYYYGYLLRQHGDQVAAMRAFIAGTHAPYLGRLVPLPWFSDYHILGRIYSNMGTMSHLEGDYELSYEMYKKCSEQFLRSGDTTAYYYAINDMAFCRAMQKNRSETSLLLGSIEKECTDSNVIAKIWETRAILYKNIIQYDSAIWAANHVSYNKNFESTSFLIKAQAFSRRGMSDSALHYANCVMSSSSASYQDKYNALYILTNKDSAITSHDKDSLVAVRADIGMYQTHDAKILGHAIEILQQDKNRKPHYINIGLLLLSLCIVGGVTWIAIVRIKRHRKHLYAETERERQKQLRLQQQQQQLFAEHLAIIEQNCTVIRSSNNIPDALCWKDFDQMCRYINDAFFMFVTKLTAAGKFNEYEVRLCVLVLLDLDYETISHILKRAQNGIGKAKYRVAQKLGTTTGNLRQVLINLAIDAPTKDI